MRLGPAGVRHRSPARSSKNSRVSPPMLAPWAGSSSRVVASARCAAVAMMAEPSREPRIAAAPRSQRGGLYEGTGRP